jgi:outer membrane protein TolC
MIMHRIKRIILFVSCLVVLPLSAQTTLEQCRTLAREHYPAIRQYGLVEKTRELTLRGASSAYLPQIIVGGQATWQNAVASFPQQLTSMLVSTGMDIPGIRKDQYQLSVNVEQPLWDGGKSRADKAAATAQAAVDSRQLDVDFRTLEKQVDELFFGTLMLDKRIEQGRSLVELLENNLETVRSMERNGVAMSSDVDALEAELLGAEEKVKGLESARESYLLALRLFTGAEIEALVTPLMPVNHSYTQLPELRLIDARLDAIDAQKQMLNVSSMPRLSLFAQGWYGYPGLDMFRSMVSSDWTFNAIVGVRATWNISSLFTRQNSLQKLSVARSRAEVQRDVITFNNTLQNTQKQNDIRRLEEQLELDGRIAELRHNVRLSAESKYRNGVSGLNDLLKAINDENDAETTRANHELELLKNAYELNQNTL